MRTLRLKTIPANFRRSSLSLLLVVTALVMSSLITAPPLARAATCSPTTTAELVTAINDANAGNCPGNTITLTAGTTYSFATPNYTGDTLDGDAALPRVTATVIIQGNGAIIERSSSATSSFRLLLVPFSGNLTLRNLTLRNGSAQSGANSLAFGGCISSYGPLTVQNSTLTNCASASGGAGSAIAANTVIIDSSTFYDNPGDFDSVSLEAGGTVRNSTFSNSTPNGYSKMALAISNSTVTVVNSTVTGFFNGVIVQRNAILNLKNSIVAGNLSNLVNLGSTINDQGNNITSGNPGLAPLADNGGPTKTLALKANSPAINAGDTATCADASGVNNKDQRGLPRTNDPCDIGAYELQPSATTLAVAAATGTYGGTTSLSATLTLGGNPVPNQPVSFTLNGNPVGSANTNPNGVATLNNVSLSGINVGSYPSAIGASFAANSPFGASSSTGSVTVNKAGQTITFDTPGGNPTYTYLTDTTFTVGGSASSGLTVSFSIASGPCSLNGTTVTITGAGTCVVEADQAGNGNYNAAPSVTRSFTINKANQTISFISPADGTTFTYGDVPFTVGGSASSGLTVSFSIASGPCSVSGTAVSITGAGICIVKADQAGNDNYNAAPSVTRSFTINKATPTVTVSSNPLIYNAQPHPATATATGVGGATVAGSFSFTYTPGGTSAPVNVGTYGVSVSFTSSDPNYNNASGTGSLIINQASTTTNLSSSVNPAILNQAVTLQAAVSVVAPGGGTPTGSVSFYDGTNLLGSVALNNSSAGLSIATLGAGSHSITAKYSGDSNFKASNSNALNQLVKYNICLLYDPQKQATNPGSTMPVKLQLCDASGKSVSSSSLTLTAINVDGKANLLNDSGNANPGNRFVYSSGYYQYNLKVPTSGLNSGKQHYLTFTVSGDTTNTYTASFYTK